MKSNHPSILLHQNAAFIAQVRDSQPNPPSADITDFLAQLQLLSGVPFQYLVPNAKMLPNESIRFFQVDPNWIACLVDGAYSIGRATETDTLHDRVHASVLKAATGGGGTGSPGVSGFLMRSLVVSGWPNLEVKAQDANKNPLPILRLERLSDTVVFCLVSGLIQTVEVQEPSEGLHFGMDIDDAETQFTKKLRNVNTGDQLTLPAVNVPFRPGNRRVVFLNSTNPALTTMVTSLQAGLKPTGFTTAITSAEFALEMVEGVQSVTFNNAS
jgi:hypothetical protein